MCVGIHQYTSMVNPRAEVLTMATKRDDLTSWKILSTPEPSTKHIMIRILITIVHFSAIITMGLLIWRDPSESVRASPEVPHEEVEAGSSDTIIPSSYAIRINQGECQYNYKLQSRDSTLANSSAGNDDTESNSPRVAEWLAGMAGDAHTLPRAPAASGDTISRDDTLSTAHRGLRPGARGDQLLTQLPLERLSASQRWSDSPAARGRSPRSIESEWDDLNLDFDFSDLPEYNPFDVAVSEATFGEAEDTHRSEATMSPYDQKERGSNDEDVDDDPAPLLAHEVSGPSAANASRRSSQDDRIVMPADAFYADLNWPEHLFRRRRLEAQRAFWERHRDDLVARRALLEQQKHNSSNTLYLGVDRAIEAARLLLNGQQRDGSDRVPTVQHHAPA